MTEQIICAICKKPVTKDQSSIDHMRPAGGIPVKIDVQTVHMHCNRKKRSLWQRINFYIGYWRMKITMMRDALGKEECYKTSMGYPCKHQMHGDVKECGNAEN